MAPKEGYGSLPNVARELLCGGLAGTVGITLGYPLDVVKVRMQTSNKSGLQCLTLMFKHQGFQGLYRGLTAPLFAQFFMNSLSFAGDSLALKFLEPTLKKGEIASPSNILLAGMFGGLAQCIVLVPADLVKVKMQMLGVGAPASKVVAPTTTLKCALDIVRTQGVLGLYRGFLVTALREAPSFGVYFFTYKTVSNAIRKLLKEPSSSSLSSQDTYYNDIQIISKDVDSNPTSNMTAIFLAGGIAGAASWASVYPVDVIKTHIQLNPADSKESVIGVAKRLHRTYGFRVFFRGLGVTMIRAFPVNAATFFVYENFKHYFNLNI